MKEYLILETFLGSQTGAVVEVFESGETRKLSTELAECVPSKIRLAGEVIKPAAKLGLKKGRGLAKK